MKKSIFSSVAVAILLLSGCSQKEPAVDTQQSQTQQQEVQNEQQNGGEATEVATEEVSSEMQEVGSENTASQTNEEQSLMDIQAKFQTIYFDFDKYNIRPDQQEKIPVDAKVAMEMPGDMKLRLEGNCDEWGSDEYNFALGLKRAKTVKDALIAEGVVGERITMVSYGESNPVCKEHTKECWAKNRRVDFTILP